MNIKKLFKKSHDPLSSKEKLQLIEISSKLVGPGVFYSTVIVITSFLPVFFAMLSLFRFKQFLLGMVNIGITNDDIAF